MFKQRSILALLLLVSLSIGTALADEGETWKLPLREKERALEAGILLRHNILGLYPSMVQVPPAGQKMDITTATPFSDVVHSVAWTSHYLAGASYRYAWLRDNGGTNDEIEKARLRADELFEAVYRCQRVTGKPGLLARGYLIGTGPTFDERRSATHRDHWHQGHVDGYDLRFCAGPSHHIYSAAAMGMGVYYELAAKGEQKNRARKAIYDLVSWWVDKDYKITGYDENSRPPFSILGYTDGRTLNTRVIMAISGARIAYHVTGEAKFKRAFDDLVARYGVRGLKSFRAAKGYDDAHHVFAHLDLLNRIEKDKELRTAYAVVADGLWKDDYTREGHSHFIYIYYHLRPDAPGKEVALKNAYHTLATWPTNMTIEPVMSSLNPAIKLPYPVYATGWDNEFMWKGNLVRPNSHTSRVASSIIVSRQTPHVAAVVDPNGHLYLTHDGGATAAGWRCISDQLKSPVRGATFGARTRIMAVACDDGYYLTETAGDRWRRLPLKTEHPPRSVQFDSTNPTVLYAMTARSIHRSVDYGAEFAGDAWENVGALLPRGVDFEFSVVPADKDGKSRILARNGFWLFSKSSLEPKWQVSQLGIGRYGKSLDWLIAHPEKPGHLSFGVLVGGGGIPQRTIIQRSEDAGRTWMNTERDTNAAFSAGTLLEFLNRFPKMELRQIQYVPGSSSEFYAVDNRGVVHTGSGRNWSPRMDGLRIPRVDRLFCQPHSDRIYASTPAGIYHLKNGESRWRSSHLVMQWRKNERRELGGAAFMTAYWRALTFGFIKDEQPAQSQH